MGAVQGNNRSTSRTPGRRSSRTRGRLRHAADRDHLSGRTPSRATSARSAGTTGPSPLWKASDQHVINDRLLVDVQWAHLGNNFVLDFHEDGLADVQPTFDISTGVWGRSFQRVGPFIRPTHSVDVTTSYFLPSALGGDHAFKFGYRWRTAQGRLESHFGGNTVARFAIRPPTARPRRRLPVPVPRRLVNYDLKTHALYVQDTFTVRRMTLNLGVRWDRRTTKRCQRGARPPVPPDWLPAVVPRRRRLRRGLERHLAAPRRDLRPPATGKTVVKAATRSITGSGRPTRRSTR